MSDESCIGCDMLNNENSALAKENARLREALNQYAYMHTDFCLSWNHPPLDASRFCDCLLNKVARAALSEEKE